MINKSAYVFLRGAIMKRSMQTLKGFFILSKFIPEKFLKIPAGYVLILISVFFTGLSCENIYETLEDYNSDLVKKQYFNVSEVVYPGIGKTNVPVNSGIVVEFDDNIDMSTVSEATFIVDRGAGAVPGVATIDETQETVTFDPAGILDYDTVYTVTLTKGILNLTGKSLASNYTWSFKTAVAPRPRIYVETPEGFEIPSNYVYNMGDEVNELTKSVVFKIGNNGNTDLSIGTVILSNLTDYSFSGITGPIIAGTPVPFTVNFNPKSVGTKTASITIVSDDPDVNPFVLNLAGESVTAGNTSPEIEIKYKKKVLKSSASKVDFGEIDVGKKISKKIVIRNIGTSDLHISAITISGAYYDYPEWFSTEFITPSTIMPGNSKEAVIWFKPLMGKKAKAVITFTNDDADEGSFNITLKGEGDD